MAVVVPWKDMALVVMVLRGGGGGGGITQVLDRVLELYMGDSGNILGAHRLSSKLGAWVDEIGDVAGLSITTALLKWPLGVASIHRWGRR